MSDTIQNAGPTLPTAKKTPPAAPVPAVEKKTPPGTELLLAWAVPKKNPKILICYKPDTDPSNPMNLVTVNVRANFNFMLNMCLRGNKVSDKVYDLVGPLPRWRGRW
jgi:hypothetical protein